MDLSLGARYLSLNAQIDRFSHSHVNWELLCKCVCIIENGQPTSATLQAQLVATLLVELAKIP